MISVDLLIAPFTKVGDDFMLLLLKFIEDLFVFDSPETRLSASSYVGNDFVIGLALPYACIN